MAKELRLQALCFQWHWNTFPQKRGRLRRIKNELDNHAGGKHRMIQLAENKATGIVAGTPDFMLLHEGVHFIEMKTDTGKLSDAQKEFVGMCAEEGVLVHVAHNFEQFCAIIYNIYGTQFMG